MAAVNENGEGPRSAASSITPADKPSQMAQPTATVTGDSVEIEWVAPEANGSAITGYSIEISTSANFATVLRSHVSGAAARSYTFEKRREFKKQLVENSVVGSLSAHLRE